MDLQSLVRLATTQGQWHEAMKRISAYFYGIEKKLVVAKKVVDSDPEYAKDRIQAAIDSMMEYRRQIEHGMELQLKDDEAIEDTIAPPPLNANTIRIIHQMQVARIEVDDPVYVVTPATFGKLCELFFEGTRNPDGTMSYKVSPASSIYPDLFGQIPIRHVSENQGHKDGVVYCESQGASSQLQAIPLYPE